MDNRARNIETKIYRYNQKHIIFLRLINRQDFFVILSHLFSVDKCIYILNVVFYY